jgi:hypothetical protein
LQLRGCLSCWFVVSTATCTLALEPLRPPNFLSAYQDVSFELMLCVAVWLGPPLPQVGHMHVRAVVLSGGCTTGLLQLPGASGHNMQTRLEFCGFLHCQTPVMDVLCDAASLRCSSPGCQPPDKCRKRRSCAFRIRNIQRTYTHRCSRGLSHGLPHGPSTICVGCR